MSNHWFTSDVHFFFHKNIIKYCNRPFLSVEDMNEQLINNWNNCVSIDDNIYSLGDFAFCKIGQLKEILSRLNGNITMITGNHDETIIDYKDELIAEGYVKEIVPYKEIRVNNQFICLFHYGQRVWNRGHKGSWQLYGHSHNSLPPHGKSVDVGVDSTHVTGKAEYRPFSFYEIKDMMSLRTIEISDQHEIRDSK